MSRKSDMYDKYGDIIPDGYTEERKQSMTKEEILKELWNCRNELCLKCERYKEAWNGACNDCRYNFENMEKWKESPDEVADDKHI